MLTKSRLAIVLSRMQGFDKPNPGLEQYQTDAEVAASVLWNAFMQGDIKGKIVADLGSGTGILGLGALALGARFVFFVEVDEAALRLAKHNYEAIASEGEPHFFKGDVASFDQHVEVVIQNPPFGVQQSHADRVFLEKAFEIADVVYSLHKLESKGFVESFAAEHGFKVTHVWHYSFPLKQTMGFHTHRITRIRVGCWRLENKKLCEQLSNVQSID
ncbi:MAG: METTL5 family protein [Candidatus Woesearchaeota archaeon]